MKIISPAFSHGESIPKKFSCDGDNISPELHITDVPEGAKSLVLIVDDHDVPAQVKWDCYFDHWVVYNIPPDTTVISEGAHIGVIGANSKGESKYTGPCPPTAYAPTTHHYNFRLLALDNILDLPAGAIKAEVLTASKDHVIAEHILTGTFNRA